MYGVDTAQMRANGMRAPVESGRVRRESPAKNVKNESREAQLFDRVLMRSVAASVAQLPLTPAMLAGPESAFRRARTSASKSPRTLECSRIVALRNSANPCGKGREIRACVPVAGRVWPAAASSRREMYVFNKEFPPPFYSYDRGSCSELPGGPGACQPVAACQGA